MVDKSAELEDIKFSQESLSLLMNMVDRAESDELKFSQESLSLLLNNGDTGVSVENYIPTSTSAFTPSPTTASDQKNRMDFFLDSTPTQQPPQPTPLIADDLPGYYDFTIKFEELQEYKKNHPKCYCRSRNTLIVKDKTSIPFTFTTTYPVNQDQLWLKVVAVYADKDSFNTPVVPCSNHSGASQGTPTEFITCANDQSSGTIEQDRHILIIPVSALRDLTGGSTELTENFTFNCRTSCSTETGSKGINGRKLHLVFQLVRQNGVVVGRRVIFLKVSVSPGRDIETLRRQSSLSRGRKRSRTPSEGPNTPKTEQEPQPEPEVPGPSSVKRPKVHTSVKGAGKYSVVVNTVEWRDKLQMWANAVDVKCDTTDHDYDDWFRFLGPDVPSIDSSVCTQENGSQPDQYSLEGWLARYGLEGYSPTLREGGFGTPEKFQTLNRSDLDEMGITDKCHRLTLEHAAKRVLLRNVKQIAGQMSSV